MQMEQTIQLGLYGVANLAPTTAPMPRPSLSWTSGHPQYSTAVTRTQAPNQAVQTSNQQLALAISSYSCIKLAASTAAIQQANHQRRSWRWVVTVEGKGCCSAADAWPRCSATPPPHRPMAPRTPRWQPQGCPPHSTILCKGSEESRARTRNQGAAQPCSPSHTRPSHRHMRPVSCWGATRPPPPHTYTHPPPSTTQQLPLLCSSAGRVGGYNKHHLQQPYRAAAAVQGHTV